MLHFYLKYDVEIRFVGHRNDIDVVWCVFGRIWNEAKSEGDTDNTVTRICARE